MVRTNRRKVIMRDFTEENVYFNLIESDQTLRNLLRSHSENPTEKRERVLPDLFPKKKVIPKGCKYYTIDGVTVWASNEKTAIKKVEKILGGK